MLPIAQIAALHLPSRGIGADNDLLFSIPEDLTYFRDITKDAVVIMGSNTWDSLPEPVRPLPNRTNIVLNHEAITLDGATVVTSIEEAITAAQEAASKHSNNYVFVMGGGSIYKIFLPHTDTFFLTEITGPLTKPPTIFYPELPPNLLRTEVSSKKTCGDLTYQFVRYDKN